MGCVQSFNKNAKKLEECTLENTPELDFENYEGPCKVLSIHDGDTIWIALLVNDYPYQVKCRLKGIDCAEIATKNPEEKKVGFEGKDYLSNRILGKVIWARCEGYGKWGGRIITEFFMTEEDMRNGKNVNNELVEEGYGYYYEGGKKKSFEEWYKMENETENEEGTTDKDRKISEK